MKKIPLTQGQFALVGDEDFEELSRFKWQAHFNRSTRTFVAQRHSHHQRRVDGTWKSVSVEMHNEIMRPSAGVEIDHRNLDTLDNQRCNLRVATHSQNSMNRRKRRGCKFPYKGIFQNDCGKFTTRLIINGCRRSVGTFCTLIEAAAAYNKAAKIYYGKFARLNEI